ncbi:Uncharacterized protein C4C5.03 [Erysiphe neolycopersici]|uniref:Uncharacterized protein C4C5.03 n=1 Tax=Erysiphe neolycopersici TaxID=212602 RepID=A0A420HUB1_9PEZI|nr:Uncharacterized protein C4C5.03 [Erysiphe neolycopersici]
MNFIFEKDTKSFNSRCKLLQEINYVNLVLSIFILLGILVSYLSQHYRIISRRTSEGISPFFILLGATSGTCALANVLTLPASRDDISCCNIVTLFECTAGLLGILQIFVQWLCFSIIVLLFLVFFPQDSEISEEDVSFKYTRKTAGVVASICLSHALVVLIISTCLLLFRPSYLGAWADFLGVLAAVLSIIQYLPQLWTTWTLGHVGSLSIPMMLIQTPGSFVWAGSLAVRLGTDGWSTWGVFLMTGCLQGSLLVMGVYYELRRRNSSIENMLQSEFHGVVTESSSPVTPKPSESPIIQESTPLLSGRKKNRKLRRRS